MEKLLELLNEYDPYIQSDGTFSDNFWRYVSQGHSSVFPKEFGVSKIVSKSYGFIKRLVLNDKINLDFILKVNGQFRLFYHDLERVKNYDRLIMYLSVEYDPITFLSNLLY